MAMTTKTAIRISLLIPIVLFAAVFLTPGGAGYWPLFAAVVFVVWAAGLLLGLFLAVIFKKPKAEPWFYLGAVLVAFAAVIIPLVVINLESNSIAAGKFARMNRRFLESERPGKQPAPYYIKAAFSRFELQVPHPYTILLKEYRTNWKDTVIEGKRDTIYDVFFTYDRDRYRYYGEVGVCRGIAVVVTSDLQVKPDSIYAGWSPGVSGRRDE